MEGEGGDVADSGLDVDQMSSSVLDELLWSAGTVPLINQPWSVLMELQKHGPNSQLLDTGRNV